MIYNAYITSGTLKPTKLKNTNKMASLIRIVAGIFIAGGMIIGLLTIRLWLIPISIFTALIIDACAEILIMLKIIVNQEYELHNVTIQIETDEVMPVSIIEENEYFEEEISDED